MSEPSVSVVDPSGFSLPYDYCLCNGLAKNGVETTLFTTAESDKYALPDPQFTCCEHYYRHTSALSPPGPMYTISKGVEHVRDQVRFVNQSSPDVVHFQWAPVPMIDVCVLQVLRSRRPVVFTAHNVLPHEYSRRDRYLRRFLYRSVDHLIVHTEESKRDLCSMFAVTQDDVTVIPHGNFRYLREYDPDVSRLPSRVQSLADVPTLLSFGLIRKYKRLDRTIRALSHVRDVVPDAVLLVVGDPRTDMGPYYDLVAELGLEEAVTFVTEYVPDEDISSYFAVSDVAVFPYERIDQSGAALLAASMGVPIVATDVRGLASAVEDGTNGRLVAGDPNAIADGVVPLLRDEALRRQYGRASRERAETKFDWDRIAELTCDVYEEVRSDA